MADPTEPHFKVVYNKLGQIVDVEPLQGGVVTLKNQPMKENPIEKLASMTDTHIFMGNTDENCIYVHMSTCYLHKICW